MYTTTTYNPQYGPRGEPYCVVCQQLGGETREWYWTLAEAWARRDELLDQDYILVQVLGAPTHLAGG